MESWSFITGKDVKNDLIQLHSVRRNPRLRKIQRVAKVAELLSGEAGVRAPPPLVLFPRGCRTASSPKEPGALC